MVAVAEAPWKPLESAIGPVEELARLGSSVWQLRLRDREFVVKAGAGIADEAAGLRALGGVPGAPPVPEVVLLDERAEVLVTSFVRQGPRSILHDEALGRALATLHTAAWPSWGGGSSFIGDCRVLAATTGSAADFYAARLSELASRCGLETEVGRATTKLPHVLTGAPPSLVHGDLWWGNVLAGEDGRSWLIDPSVHGGLAEEDLGMLDLFGRVPERVLRAYEEVRPLEAGWRERARLLQLYPLLVHTVLFGGAYRVRAREVALSFA